MACRVEHCDCPRGQVNKSWNVQRHTVVEEARASFEHCFAVFGQGQNETNAGSGADRIRNRVAIKAQAQALVVGDGQNWMVWWWVCIACLLLYLPTILVLAGSWSPARARAALSG